MPHDTKGPGRTKGRFTVLFDGSCPLCAKSVETLRSRDREGILDFFPTQDPVVPDAFPWISPEALSESIHLVGPGGETWEGIGAVEKLTRLLPGLRWLTHLLALPFSRKLAGYVYGWIARNRYKISCGSHC